MDVVPDKLVQTMTGGTVYIHEFIQSYLLSPETLLGSEESVITMTDTVFATKGMTFCWTE